jgi:hypothetical protein
MQVVEGGANKPCLLGILCIVDTERVGCTISDVQLATV